MKTAEAIAYLTEESRRLLEGCRVTADDGTVLYTPDGEGNYRALWTRDFAYMVENAGDLIPLDHIEACIRFLLRGQRGDGWIPDRVTPDGTPVYTAGPETSPVGEPNLDNAAFLVILVDTYLRHLPMEDARRRFREWGGCLKNGLDAIPRTARGLVGNNPVRPHSPYGFTDCIGKTGELFKESLLYWTACRRYARWCRMVECERDAADLDRRAARIEANIWLLWDDEAGAFYAATGDCRQHDIWGLAYAHSIEFPLNSHRERAVEYLEEHIDEISWHGQIRHLPRGEHWHRLLVPVDPETYQNGAYWATATGWMIHALACSAPVVANRLVAQLLADFRRNGICECVNESYRKLPNYVVSATNPLGAIRRLAASL